MAKPTEKKPRCVFYPKLLCSVRTEMQKESIIGNIIKPDLKKLPDETQFVLKMTDALKGVYEMKWMNLSNFCRLCAKKDMQDSNYRNKKLGGISKLESAPAIKPPPSITCPKCNEKLPPIMNYCPKCGAKLEKRQPP